VLDLYIIPVELLALNASNQCLNHIDWAEYEIEYEFMYVPGVMQYLLERQSGSFLIGRMRKVRGGGLTVSRAIPCILLQCRSFRKLSVELYRTFDQ
jgi:hypothetical protein